VKVKMLIDYTRQWHNSW